MSRPTKYCNGCKSEKPVEQFSKQSRRKDGLQSSCKQCNKDYRERNRERNREYLADYYQKNKGAQRDRALKSLHKKSLAWYERTLEEQGGGCSICKRRPREGENFHVDHDHSCCPRVGNDTRSCGECTRGILCPGCNTGIGKLKDSPEILRNAIAYLENWEKQ